MAGSGPFAAWFTYLALLGPCDKILLHIHDRLLYDCFEGVDYSLALEACLV